MHSIFTKEFIKEFEGHFSVSRGLSSTIVSSAKLTHANRYLSSRITGFIQYEKIKVEQTEPQSILCECVSMQFYAYIMPITNNQICCGTPCSSIPLMMASVVRLLYAEAKSTERIIFLFDRVFPAILQLSIASACMVWTSSQKLCGSMSFLLSIIF
ncbi:Hypothetical_protein [Hexamita inflata]|uniref:Hypothetical_protein n=1 Tax=Hexamita inflata TaxID=28002 RepID=A0AA86TGP2_9EUKA|nr:Hypothetical protein HINF_LOCUS393 [Hexamita inflata]